jgi:hypothetical protein
MITAHFSECLQEAASDAGEPDNRERPELAPRSANLPINLKNQSVLLMRLVSQ